MEINRVLNAIGRRKDEAKIRGLEKGVDDALIVVKLFSTNDQMLENDIGLKHLPNGLLMPHQNNSWGF